MAKQLLIYENVVPLNRVAHRDLSVRQTSNFVFAARTNSVPIVDIEFVKVAPEMPIVFTRTQTGLVCVALVGAEQDRNAFVGWDGRYVPAFFRRYPFVFAVQEGSDRLTLCIDEGYEGINDAGIGERMFDAEGSETSYTRTVLRFVEEYQATFNRTQAFCDRLAASGLLEEARVDYTLADGTQGGVTGFLRVSVEKLRALPDDAVLAMFRSGDLDLIQMHLMSMQQIEPLVARVAARSGAAAAPAGEKPGKAGAKAARDTSMVN
ncbi:MAG: peptidase [Rhodobacteraceae bacterium]|nr:peptidase [Paracoccaceae bacterium]